MAKTVHSDILDGALNVTKTGTRLCVCNAQPTTYTEAITTFKLAIKTITSGDFTGPAAGDAGGGSRKITINEQTGIPVDSGGTAIYIALCDSVNSKLLFVTTCTSQVLTAGNTVTIPAFKQEFADPT